MELENLTSNPPLRLEPLLQAGGAERGSLNSTLSSGNHTHTSKHHFIKHIKVYDASASSTLAAEKGGKSGGNNNNNNNLGGNGGKYSGSDRHVGSTVSSTTSASSVRIPSSHELALLQQELSRLKQSCDSRSSLIRGNGQLIYDWLAAGGGSNDSDQQSNEDGNGTMVSNQSIISDSGEAGGDAAKQKKIKLKIKGSTAGEDTGVYEHTQHSLGSAKSNGAAAKDHDQTVDDSMDIDNPGSIAASSADELDDIGGLRASIKTGNGGQVSISNNGRIKMSATPPPGAIGGKASSSVNKPVASKKGDVKNKLKQRVKKRSLTEREISATISGSASLNSRMTPDIPESSAPRPGEGDYSHVKGLPPNQIPIATFWTFMEQYFRNLVPEDMQALASKGDEVTPFMIPPLGKHYLQQWREEDQKLLALFNDCGIINPAVATNKEYAEVDDCVFEGDIHLGPLSDRLVAAFIKEGLVPDNGGVFSSSLAVASGASGAGTLTLNPSSSATNLLGDIDVGASSKNAASRIVPRIRSKTDLSLFEERLREELVHLGLLEYEEGFDGGIGGNEAATSSLGVSVNGGGAGLGDSTSVHHHGGESDILKLLKATQSQLATQIQANFSKKKRILEIAEEWMAFQEFNTLLDDINKTVDTAYIKRFKSNKPKSNKKEKSKFPASNIPLAPSMRGFTTETIVQILESRRRLLEEVGAKFFPLEKFTPPTKSIYEHLHHQHHSHHQNTVFPPPP